MRFTQKTTFIALRVIFLVTCFSFVLGSQLVSTPKGAHLLRPSATHTASAATATPVSMVRTRRARRGRYFRKLHTLAHLPILHKKAQPVYRISTVVPRSQVPAHEPAVRPVAMLAAAARPAEPWHTAGSEILDADNRPVRIAGISWYGFETTTGAPHGLTHQDFRSVLAVVRGNGYNTIRLPFSNAMVASTAPPEIAFQDVNGEPINTELEGLTSLQVMDHIIRAAGDLGLRVILDNHRSTPGNGPEANGLWYTEEFPEATWIHDWQTLAARYADNPTVVGMDLRNEPHNATTGGACWGCGRASQDWRLAAERAGDAILRVNPRLLIFVEGTDAVGGDFYWWGGNLEGVATAPVRLNVPNHLVYSAHDYGPSEFAQPWFNAGTSTHSLDAVWTRHWAYISQRGIAPVWLSEFGTPNDVTDLRSSTPGSEGQWFGSLVSFLQANPDLSWAYWAVNGDDRYGLLNANFDRTPTSPLKQQALTSIEGTTLRNRDAVPAPTTQVGLEAQPANEAPSPSMSSLSTF